MRQSNAFMTFYRMKANSGGTGWLVNQFFACAGEGISLI